MAGILNHFGHMMALPGVPAQRPIRRFVRVATSG
jgi:hypothetical protein